MAAKINDLLDYAIKANASDLHLSVGSIPMVRIDGKMQTLQLSRLKNEDMIKVRDQVLNDNQKNILDERLEIDFSYQIKDSGRFRVNFFNQINGLSAAFRIIPTGIKTSDELGIPPIMNKLALMDKSEEFSAENGTPVIWVPIDEVIEKVKANKLS